MLGKMRASVNHSTVRRHSEKGGQNLRWGHKNTDCFPPLSGAQSQQQTGQSPSQSSHQRISHVGTMTTKRIGSSLVPWGILSRSIWGLEITHPQCEGAWELSSRNAATNLRRQLWTPLRSESFLIKIMWSMRSKPFLKSAKKSLTWHRPLSSTSNAKSNTYTKASEVDLPETANCFASNAPRMLRKMRASVNPSKTLETWHLNEMRRMSSSILLGGRTLGRGWTIALFRAEGMYPSRSDAL